MIKMYEKLEKMYEYREWEENKERMRETEEHKEWRRKKDEQRKEK